jgi:ABC-2 type transport system ATP-binding protein
VSVAVKFDGVVKDYRYGVTDRKLKRALDGLSFDVPRGTITALLGPNGAGKSTAFHLLVGFLVPSEGTVEVFDMSPTDPASRRDVGFLPEIFAFDRFVTGRRLLRMFDALSGSPREGRESRVDAALRAVAMENEADAKVRTYSKGLTQRIGLAQALLGDPELAILDEPMSGMDPSGRVAMQALLDERRARGKTTLVSSHILPEMQALADSIVIVHHGKVRAQGSFEELSGEASQACVGFSSTDQRPLSALSDRGMPEPQPVGEGRFVLSCPADRVDEAVATLVGAGASIDDVSRNARNLESLFLELTRES